MEAQEESREPTPPGPRRKRASARQEQELLDAFHGLVDLYKKERDPLAQFCQSLLPQLRQIPEPKLGEVQLEIWQLIMRHRRECGDMAQHAHQGINRPVHQVQEGPSVMGPIASTSTSGFYQPPVQQRPMGPLAQQPWGPARHVGWDSQSVGPSQFFNPGWSTPLSTQSRQGEQEERHSPLLFEPL